MAKTNADEKKNIETLALRLKNILPNMDANRLNMIKNQVIYYVLSQ